jgi:hypothetical protein
MIFFPPQLEETGGRNLIEEAARLPLDRADVKEE